MKLFRPRVHRQYTQTSIRYYANTTANKSQSGEQTKIIDTSFKKVINFNVRLCLAPRRF